MEGSPSKAVAKGKRLKARRRDPFGARGRMIAARPRLAARPSLLIEEWLPLTVWQRCALVFVAAGVGAVLGAGLHPQPVDRYQADAVVAVQQVEPDGPGDVAVASKALAEAIQVPQVAQAAARSLPAGSRSPNLILTHVKAQGDPSGGLIRIRARAATQALATTLAGSMATEAVSYLRTNLQDPRAPSTFMFDRGAEGWRSGSIFSVASRTFAITRTHSLAFACTGEQVGCGVGVQLERMFTPDTTYRARARARAAAGGGRVQLVLGPNARDVATSRPLTLRSRYRTLTVTWIPTRPVGVATLALQTVDKRPARIILDTVQVVPEGATSVSPAVEAASSWLTTSIRARRSELSNRYTTVGTAAPVANATAPTVRWAFLGALMGALIVTGGLICAAAASRRAQ